MFRVSSPLPSIPLSSSLSAERAGWAVACPAITTRRSSHHPNITYPTSPTSASTSITTIEILAYTTYTSSQRVIRQIGFGFAFDKIRYKRDLARSKSTPHIHLQHHRQPCPPHAPSPTTFPSLPPPRSPPRAQQSLTTMAA